MEKSYYIYNPKNNIILPDKTYYYKGVSKRNLYHELYFQKNKKWISVYGKHVLFSNYEKYSHIKSHFKNIKSMGRKTLLYEKIKHKKYALDFYTFSISDGINDIINKLSVFDNELFFLKKDLPKSYGGFDVFPVITNKNFKADLKKAIDESNSLEKYYHEDFILQKGVRNPDLIDGRKYDFRAYFLITSFEGIARGYLFKTALIRKSQELYDANSLNRKAQLTNTTQSYELNKNENTTELYSIESNIKCDESLFVEYTKDLFNLYKEEFEQCENPTYNLIGLDYIVDSEKNLFLIEANSKPAIYDDEKRRKLLHHNLEYTIFNDEFFNITIEFFAGNILPLELEYWYKL